MLNPKFILDQMDELVFILDLDLKIEYYNKAASKQTVKLKCDSSFLDIISSSDSKRVSIKLHQTPKNHSDKTIIKVRMLDLKINERWFVLSVKHIDNKFLIIASPVERVMHEESDILEREAALADSENLGNIGSWWVNIDTKVNHWSKGNFSLWNVDPRENPLSLNEVLKRIHPEDAKRIMNAIDTVGQTVETQDLTFRMMKDNKPYRYFITRIRPWHINGELKEVKGVNVEITDIVKTQKKLEDKLHIISQHNEKMAEYIFMNSHEVRRPMSNILSLIELAKNDNLTRPELIKLLEKESIELDLSIQRMNRLLSAEESILQTNLES